MDPAELRQKSRFPCGFKAENLLSPTEPLNRSDPAGPESFENKRKVQLENETRLLRL